MAKQRPRRRTHALLAHKPASVTQGHITVSPLSPKREKRQRAILACARDAFADRGYHAVTIEEIVQRTGIARGTFYLYFEDKRAILSALLDAFLARITACIEPVDLEDSERSALEQLRANLQRVTQLVLDEPAMVRILLRSATQVDGAFDAKRDAFYQTLNQYLEETVAAGQAAGLVRLGERPWLRSMGMGALQQLFLERVEGQLSGDAEALTEGILAFLLQGLLTASMQGHP
ncbi:MAG: TetR/AcrR family transcriptional regulator [Polyangiales bacterium]